MEFYEMLDTVTDAVDAFVTESTEKVKPEEIGLDNREGYTLFINEDVIVVDKERDKGLQYYGGFEYVDAEYRTEIGAYVFYSCEDERVQGHIQKWLDNKIVQTKDTE